MGYVHGTTYTGHESEREFISPWAPGGNTGAEDGHAACTHEGSEPAVRARIKRLAALGDSEVWVTLNDIEYVLGTGRNWRGPIGKFVLRIEKAFPEQIASLFFLEKYAK